MTQQSISKKKVLCEERLGVGVLVHVGLNGYVLGVAFISFQIPRVNGVCPSLQAQVSLEGVGDMSET